MARAALKDVVFPDWFKGACRRTGTFYVYQPGTAVEATVYQDATGATALTQPLTFADFQRHLGFVEPADYTLSSGLVSFNCNVSGGSGFSGAGAVSAGFAGLVDTSLAQYNYNPYLANSAACTTTDGTARYIRFVPQAKIVAAKIHVFSGTAVA